MFGKPPGRSRASLRAVPLFFVRPKQLNSRVVALTPATPRADARGAISGLSTTRPWRINIGADSHGTASSGDSLIPYWNLNSFGKANSHAKILDHSRGLRRIGHRDERTGGMSDRGGRWGRRGARRWPSCASRRSGRLRRGPSRSQGEAGKSGERKQSEQPEQVA